MFGAFFVFFNVETAALSRSSADRLYLQKRVIFLLGHNAISLLQSDVKRCSSASWTCLKLERI